MTTPMLTVCAIAAVAVLVWHVFALPMSNPYYGIFSCDLDLQVYRAGGQALLERSPLYRGPIVWEMEFTYTPFAALVFVPLALVGVMTAKVLWWIAILVALVALVARCLLVLRYENTARTWVFATLLAMVCTALEPVRSTIWLGQINVFLVLLIVWDLTRPADARLRGIGVGLAAGIKLTPAFFLLYLACTRQWRTLGIATATFAATIGIGFLTRPRDAWTYWGAQVTTSGRVGAVDSPGNQSINGSVAQLLRFLDADGFRIGTVYTPPMWMWLAAAIPVIALGLYAATLAYRSGHVLLAITVAGMTSACASPFSWGHHWVWFMPLFILAIHHVRTAVDPGRWVPLAVVLSVSFCWWWNYPDRPPLAESPHPIGIGLFMLPRDDIPDWWSYIAVPVYAACYPMLLIATAIYVITRRRDLPAHPDAEPGSHRAFGTVDLDSREPLLERSCK
ncbi:glycosyltransferase 87 family protein [Nocardia sp. NBC_01503]|uniref:glycosyltransferase 87 family protein n=1 Tax=Nocardia sp. NBC_01503 TaxID=2975997 RepID=UPI002E7BE897|nr:glycosyltransferase 87 family protein [Nocardia sp. NBC_01503]WTL30189.1 glycosyltransferase 87 family protein [Nocardia sp. NBC_01503]